MCLILLSYRQRPQYPFIFLSNRDEFYARPSSSASFWESHPSLLAGKDLEKAGTWLGITRQGRFSAVTNFRDPSSTKTGTLSRGELVRDYLLGEMPPEQYLNEIAKKKDQYNGFNLLVGNQDQLSYYSNHDNHIHTLKAGLYGVSNHLLDTPWPKVTRGKQLLSDLITSQKTVSIEKCLDLLSDKTPFKDEELPDTGISLKEERHLSPIFISTQAYGTRASTVILIDHLGRVTFVEKYYLFESQQWKKHQFQFFIS